MESQLCGIVSER